MRTRRERYALVATMSPEALAIFEAYDRVVQALIDESGDPPIMCLSTAAARVAACEIADLRAQVAELSSRVDLLTRELNARDDRSES